MLRRALWSLVFGVFYFPLHAQDNEVELPVEKGGFKKENLFTGGSISLSFFNNTFLIGANPVLGYKLAQFADAGLQVNIQHLSSKYTGTGEKMRQTLYGGGVFARLFPINFLFAQGQWEHNWVTTKDINASGLLTRSTRSTNSLLVGGGYASGRNGQANAPFFYMMLLFDVSKVSNTPYTDGLGNPFPIIRAGLTIPLFQGPKIGYR
ncbi:MAG: hypothetical protein RL732_1347 [Bacteroidota bacterium]